MLVYRWNDTTAGETIKCLVMEIANKRVLFSLAETVWTTPGKSRKVPIYFNKKTVYIYRLAIRFGKPQKKGESNDNQT